MCCLTVTRFLRASQQHAQNEVFQETNIFTSFAVQPEDLDLDSASYVPVPSMNYLKQDLQDRIKV